MAVASAGTSTALQEPTTFETETIFEIFARQQEFDSSIAELDTLIQAVPAEKTVRAARAWFASLNDLKGKVLDLKTKISGWIWEKQEKRFQAINLKINVLYAHLVHTLEKRKDEGAYYFHTQAQEDLAHLGEVSLEKCLGSGAHSNIYGGKIGPFKRAFKIVIEPQHRVHLYHEARVYTSFPEYPGLLRAGLLMPIDFDGRMRIAQSFEQGCENAYSIVTNCNSSLPEELKKMFTQVADTLQFFHKRGAVHNDVKPENIVRCADGRYVLIDFEMKKRSGQRFSGGTYGYVAPEIYLRVPSFPKRDVFSYGVTLFCSITDHEFYTEESLRKVSRAKFLESDISAQFSLAKPTPEAESIVAEFKELLFLKYDLVTHLLYTEYKILFNEIFLFIKELPKEKIQDLVTDITTLTELTEIKELSSNRVRLLLRHAKTPSLLNSVLMNNILVKILPCFIKIQPLSVAILIEFLNTPKETLETFLRCSASLQQIRSKFIDPEGLALHLARYCTRVNPDDRPTMEQVLEHPYFGNTELTPEDWRIKFELPAVE